MTQVSNEEYNIIIIVHSLVVSINRLNYFKITSTKSLQF